MIMNCLPDSVADRRPIAHRLTKHQVVEVISRFFSGRRSLMRRRPVAEAAAAGRDMPQRLFIETFQNLVIAWMIHRALSFLPYRREHTWSLCRRRPGSSRCRRWRQADTYLAYKPL